MGEKCAAIDLGTNTARLLIGEVLPSGNINHLLIKRIIVRLGGAFTIEKGLSIEARQRAMEAIATFAADIAEHKVSKIRAVATSAVRDAINGKEFLQEILQSTGVQFEIIDGEQEGLLTLSGVFSAIDSKQGRFVVFDIGGGSTEYTLSMGEKPIFTSSLPLGVVRLTEGKNSPEAMRDKIERELSALKDQLQQKELLGSFEQASLVGTAGTVTTLAAIKLQMSDYDYRKVNNFVMQYDDISSIYRQLLPLSPAERLLVPGLEKGREDLIIAGILVTLTTMEMFGFRQLKVSDFGLLEGVLASIS